MFAYMVTGPYFLDLDPFRSSKSKLELVQFHSPYLKSNFVQFQIHSSSKILPKSSKFIPVAEILQAFLLNFSTYKTGKPCRSIKRPFSCWKHLEAPHLNSKHCKYITKEVFHFRQNSLHKRNSQGISLFL